MTAESSPPSGMNTGRTRRPAGFLSWARGLKGVQAARAMFRRGDREVDGHLRALANSIECRDWQGVEAEALALGAIGEKRGERGLMKKAGRTLRRVGGGRRAWQLLSLSKMVEGRPEWDGSDLVGRTILIDRREGDLAIFLQFASLLATVSTVAEKCIVLVEPRIAPLYRRTFPALDVRMEETETERAQAEADVFASFETLALHLWPDEEAQRSRFVALQADGRVAQSLRDDYLAGGKERAIGFAWGSLNKSKEMPSLAEWEVVLPQLPGKLVSLQYGAVGPALQQLRRSLGDRLIHDTSVDQLVDMDRFAAQLASLDAVFTISNTGAHLAGAMGLPGVVAIDDRFHLSWPAVGSSVASYPGIVIVRRQGRDWSAVMEEARNRLDTLMRERG